jgi:hypothetical protein
VSIGTKLPRSGQLFWADSDAARSITRAGCVQENSPAERLNNSEHGRRWFAHWCETKVVEITANSAENVMRQLPADIHTPAQYEFSGIQG